MSAQRLPCWSRVMFRSFTIVCALCSVSLQVSPLLAQASPIPYGPDGPSFHLRSYSYVYPNSYRSMHDVDFENLKVALGNDENGKPSLVQLRNGGREVKFRIGGYDSIYLGGVHFLSSDEPGREYALTVYEEDSAGGSSSQWGIAQVFELAEGRLRVTQMIDWDLHYGGPYGPLDEFDEKTNTLSFRSAHYQPGDGHCCVSSFDVVTYRWDGRAFAQTAIHTELSDYGRLKHKVHPPKSIPVRVP